MHTPEPFRSGDFVAARRVARHLFGAVLSVYLATTGGSFATDVASYEVTKSLVKHGSVAMSYNVLHTDAERGVDGRYYAPVGIGHPLFGVPFYAAAHLLQTLTGLQASKPELLTKAAVVVGSAVAAAGTVYLAFLFAWRTTGSVGGALTAALGLAFATILWPYSKFGFNAPLAAMCLLGGAYGSWMGIRQNRPYCLMLGGVSIGYALLTRHEMIVAALPVALWIWLESRNDRRRFPERLLLFAAPVVIAFVLWLLYNDVRFGNPLDTGLLRDPNVRFDTPLLVGLHGLLASPGRSLFLYSPLTLAGVFALLALAREDRSTAIFLGSLVLALLPVYGTMRHWDGGQSYGPRYLVPILPFLVVPLARWFRPDVPGRGRRMLWPVFGLSILMQLPGVLVDFSKAVQAYARSRPDYSIELSRYTWDAAPLVLNTRAALDALPRNVEYLSGRLSPPRVELTAGEADRGFSQQFAFSLDFWWLYLYYLGALSAPLALALGLAPLVVATGFALRIRDALTSRTAPDFVAIATRTRRR